MTYLLVFFTSLVTTIFLTPFYIRFLKRSKIVDLPGGRKIHTGVIPRMGGLIIFFITLVMLNAFVDDFESVKLVIISSTVIVFAGIIDDVLGLDNFIKFVVQNISAIILIYYLEQNYNSVSLLGLTFSTPYDYLILLLFIVGTYNSINFLDGLDGLATGFSILIFTVLLVLAIRKQDVFLILLNVSLLGSTLGFLRFNAFPARVFLGDTGSLVLGFFLVLTTFLTSINYHEKALDLTFPLIILAVPLVDTVKVFFVRIIKRRDPFVGDTIHQHHIMKLSIVSHEATVFIIELFSIVFIFVALFYLKDYRLEATILFFVLSALLILIQPLLLRFNLANGINNALLSLKKIPIKNLFKIIKLSLIISTFLIILVSIVNISLTTTLSNQELLLLLVMDLVLMILAFYQLKSANLISDIYVFINFALFFIVAKLSIPYVNNFISETVGSKIISEIIFYVLSALISISLLLRWKALMTKKLFFSGIDLTIIVVMLLTFIVNNILEIDIQYYLNVSLLEAFIFYVWYKIVVDLKKQYITILTLLSFVLPIISIGILLISNI